MPAHYSQKPLARELDLRDGQRVWFCDMPDDIEQEIAEYALDLTIVAAPEEGVDAAHVFVADRAKLSDLLEPLRANLAADGQIWVSWPQGSTEIDDSVIRELGQPLGLVDTKTCDVGDGWASLKLVIRKELR